LFHIVVAYENLHSVFPFDRAIARTDAKALEPLALWACTIPGADGGQNMPRYCISAC
jgi:hypothetical protein